MSMQLRLSTQCAEKDPDLREIEHEQHLLMLMSVRSNQQETVWNKFKFPLFESVKIFKIRLTLIHFTI